MAKLGFLAATLLAVFACSLEPGRVPVPPPARARFWLEGAGKDGHDGHDRQHEHHDREEKDEKDEKEKEKEESGYPVDIHPQAGMDESEPAPEQGYAIRGHDLVEHNENTTATKDWLHEWGPHLRKPPPPKKSLAAAPAGPGGALMLVGVLAAGPLLPQI